MNSPLVSTEWLAAHLRDADLRILDCSVTLVPQERGFRMQSGRGAWQEGHIPGSAFADLIGELSARDTTLPFMMPPAPQAAEVLGRHGVGHRTFVVLYDHGAHIWATRLWWMLRALGFGTAAVLDGGLKKWRAEGRALSRAPAAYPPAHFPVDPRPQYFVDKAVVRSLLGTPQVRMINALSADDHSGKVNRRIRAGHIPGSGNVPADSLLDPATGAYRPLDELRARLAAAGTLDAARVVTYCGGGIAATSVAFTLARLGIEDVAVYDGSLTEWSADPDLPMQTDVPVGDEAQS